MDVTLRKLVYFYTMLISVKFLNLSASEVTLDSNEEMDKNEKRKTKEHGTGPRTTDLGISHRWRDAMMLRSRYEEQFQMRSTKLCFPTHSLGVS